MDVKYLQKGEKGKTCADCRNFEAEVKTQVFGKCFGNQVEASGSCNYFEAKKTVS
jgi:hypothetical protein